jgi:hypothetical protein
LTGQVVEVSWRAMRLRTVDNVTHVVPNNLLGLMVVTNLSLPEPTSRFELKVCIDSSVSSDRVSPHKGRHLVLESVLQHLSAAGIGLAHPKQDLHMGPMRQIELDLNRDRGALVKRIALFESLEDDEIASIAANIRQRVVSCGWRPSGPWSAQRFRSR